jgi:hypothetical protein
VAPWQAGKHPTVEAGGQHSIRQLMGSICERPLLCVGSHRIQRAAVCALRCPARATHCSEPGLWGRAAGGRVLLLMACKQQLASEASSHLISLLSTRHSTQNVSGASGSSCSWCEALHGGGGPTPFCLKHTPAPAHGYACIHTHAHNAFNHTHMHDASNNPNTLTPVCACGDAEPVQQHPQPRSLADKHPSIQRHPKPRPLMLGGIPVLTHNKPLVRPT